MARLVVETGADVGMIFPLPGGKVTIGRSVSCDIQIIDRKVSRCHAEVIQEDNHYIFNDLDSKNGSYLNGHRVKEKSPLNDGDNLRIGETVMVFESGPEDSTHYKSETTSKSIRLVDDSSWGEPRVSVAAGLQSSLDLEVNEVERETLKDSHKRLEILYTVADAIRNILNLDDLLEQIMQIISGVIKMDRGFIMLIDPKTGDLYPAAIKKSNEDEEITISSTIVNRCISEKVAILSSDAAQDRRFSSSESIILNKIRSAICAPIIFKDDIFGVIYIDTQSGITAYDQEELELVNGIANQSAMAIANAKLHNRLVRQHKIEKEMEIARTIQMNLLPKVYPRIDDVDISAMSLPAKKVGGDYYDFIPLDDGRYGIVVADVSGKGVPAAILLATIRAALLIEARKGSPSVTSVISRMNEMACRDTTNNMYVTMIYGILDPVKKVFEYVNAGHVYPLLFHTDDSIKQLKTGGCFLGIMENAEYQSQKVTLKPGRTLVLYTDGVTDTMNPKGEIFGLARLKNCIRNNLKNSARDIRDVIYEESATFRKDADQFDDFTLIVMKFQ